MISKRHIKKHEVYCVRCHFFFNPDYYYGGGCHHPKNLNVTNNKNPVFLEETKTMIKSHKELNKENNCSWYRYKSPGPPQGG